ncbi:MAG TPA: GspE/PulE family protein [Planctomycetota bacterium]|nr:GspE/PulE family protein [Planctomycetota bacterium]HON45039.1 GspE/PulE family protein [Planctomycetota bacterium]HPY74155.1 GspE/PulE family protein [Planctomycetota bacterium]HQA99768.1 GspE/PulE family protein [Planctomycetota bacterium]HRU51749.1 GspE/PulE family protein [Planctomycetota bacterium]
MSLAYNRRVRRILMRSRKIDINRMDQFDEQLKSKDNQLSLVELILSHKLFSENELLALISIDTEIPAIQLENVTPDTDLFALIDKPTATKFQVFPISKIKNILTVAVVDPFDHSQKENLEIITSCKVIFVLSTEHSIKKAIANKYVSVAKVPSGLDAKELAKKEEKERDLKRVIASDFDAIIEESLESKAISLEDAEEQIEDANDHGIIRLVNKIIIDAHKQNASDIHIEPYNGKENTVIRFRTDGECYIYQHVPNQIKKALLSRFKLMAGLDIAERRLPQDGKIKFKQFYKNLDIELRVATIPTVGGNEDAVLRILASSKPIPLQDMAFSERNLREFKKIACYPYGLILVVGPTGSGKTTTLHSAMGYINTPKRKIWTAEDPVEITQKGLRQVQIQSKIGYTFARAMRAFLRADPDVIMVGEMRDTETASIGVEASLTGHLVLSTLHTNSAAETITRLIDMGLDPFNFADALLGVLAQRLTRRLCKECKQAHNLSQAEYDEIVEEFEEKEFYGRGPEFSNELQIYQTAGCPVCNKTGYKGRIAIHELLINCDEIRAAIQSHAKVDQIREIAKRNDMLTLKQDGILKIFQGFCDLRSVRAVCMK